MKAFLILEDGTVYQGTHIGADRDAVSEIVFNTSMAGYPEVLTDPSYAGQAVCMTYPLIGNYGICRDDMESVRPWLDGLIVRELSRVASNFRSDCTIQDFLKEYDIPGIAGIDTRALTIRLREHGTMNGLITTDENYKIDEVISKLKAYTTGKVVEKVTCREKYVVKGSETLADNGPVSGSAIFDPEAYADGRREMRPSLVRELNGIVGGTSCSAGSCDNAGSSTTGSDKAGSCTTGSSTAGSSMAGSSTAGNGMSDGRHLQVALMDFGLKKNIIRQLAMRGCDVTVYPAATTASEIIASSPDGIMLSNGPGDPKECVSEIKEIKKLYDTDIPIFAICLGHQLMALATGADTHKLKYGHRGGNHPVKDLETGRVYISSQNHGYVVDTDNLDPKIAVPAFVNVNDGTNEGLTYTGKNIFTVQFHPEACPGPQDSGYLFDRFIERIERAHA